MMTPYIATASQKMTEIRFLDFILGVLTAAPTRVDPVINIPHDAPIIDSPRASPRPTYAHE